MRVWRICMNTCILHPCSSEMEILLQKGTAKNSYRLSGRSMNENTRGPLAFVLACGSQVSHPERKAGETWGCCTTNL